MGQKPFVVFLFSFFSTLFLPFFPPLLISFPSCFDIIGGGGDTELTTLSMRNGQFVDFILYFGLLSTILLLGSVRQQLVGAVAAHQAAQDQAPQGEGGRGGGGPARFHRLQA